MKITPPGRRSMVLDSADGLNIVIPSKRNIVLLLFLSASLVAWAFGELSAAGEVVSGRAREGTLFLAAWLVAWTVGGGWAIYTWLWMAAGKEIVSLRPGTLVVKRDTLGLGRTREYELAHVKNLRVSPEAADPFGFSGGTRFWGLSGGLVAFDYGAKTVRFGGGLDEAEAALIVADLKARHAFS